MSYIDQFRLDGKTALITGASRNIGKAMATAFAEAGADLVLVARTESTLAEVGRSISADTGRTVLTRTCDVGSAAEINDLVTFVRQSAPPIDILVNNAFDNGGSHSTPILEAEEQAWQRALDVNMFGPLRLCRALVPAMAQSGHGIVVNVLSGAGFSPLPEMGPYCVSKAALWMLTRCLAREYAPTVRVNALCPGSMREGDDLRPMPPAQLNATPMARTGLGIEAAGAALFLASEASSYSTGDVVFVNGGLTSLSSYPNGVGAGADLPAEHHRR